MHKIHGAQVGANFEVHLLPSVSNKVGLVSNKTTVIRCLVGKSTAFRNLIRKAFPDANRTGNS